MNKKIILSAATIAALAGMVGSVAFAAGIPKTGTSTSGVTHVTAKPINKGKSASARLKQKPKEVKAPKSATSTPKKNEGRKVKVGPRPLINKATSTKTTR